MEICFATNNTNKLEEIRRCLGSSFTIKSLVEIGCEEELPENQTTIEANSLEKAMYVYNKYNINCFADDTGLEVSALNGEPGVYSARYAGENCSFEDNMNLLLKNLEANSNREACFKTVITLIIGGEYIQFEGIIKGSILDSRQGEKGFGYDPIFKPNGYNVTFAEMSMEEKNNISHRGLATQKLEAYLKNIK